MTKQSIGEFLATLRKANGYTQQEVADRLGISNRTLSGWECSNVLPDILLLPALGELYGVTVDEILAGERKESTGVVLSDKSEKRILKGKIARFTVQCWILLGILVTGILVTAVSAYIEVIKMSWTGFPWWRVLLVGLVPVAVCLATLFAFWKGAEMSVDDTNDNYGLYCLVLRRKLANSIYVLALANIVAAIFVAVGLFVRDSVHNVGIIAVVAFAVLAFSLFLIGWLLYKNALTKFGGEVARHSIQKDRRYFWVVGFWGIFPFVLSLILAIVLGCVRFEDKTTVYENSSTENFREYMETFVGFDTEKHFPLSELAKTAKPGDEFDLGDGYVAVYRLFSFTITNEQIMLYKLDDNGLNIVPFTIEVPRILLVDDTGMFSCFNVRYLVHYETDNCAVNDNRYVKYDGYDIERVGEGMAYVHRIVRDYSFIGYAVSFAAITVDLIVCVVLCITKRNRLHVKL